MLYKFQIVQNIMIKINVQNVLLDSISKKVHVNQSVIYVKVGVYLMENV